MWGSVTYFLSALEADPMFLRCLLLDMFDKLYYHIKVRFFDWKKDLTNQKWQ